MKKLYCGFLLAFSFIININAQITFGVKGGLNFADLATKLNGNTDYDGTRLRVAPRIGVFAEIKIIENLYFQPSILLSGKGCKKRDDDSLFSNYAPLYIDVPLLVIGKLELEDVKIYGGLGPYLSYGIGGKFSAFGEEFKVWDQDPDLNFVKRLDAGASIALGIQLQRLTLGAQYDLGLINTLDTSIGDGKIFNKKDFFKNRVISFNVGFAIFGGDEKKNAPKRYKRR